MKFNTCVLQMLKMCCIIHTCGVIIDVALNESVAITVKLNSTKEDSVTLSVHIDPF